MIKARQSNKKKQKNSAAPRSAKKLSEAMNKEITREKKQTEIPGDEQSDQFIIQEEMKSSSFAPRRSKDNPL